MFQRLDKFLSDCSIGTRSEVRKLIIHGKVTVDGVTVCKPETKVDSSVQKIICDQVAVETPRTVLCVLNKPSGFVTSTDDPFSPTVMSLVPQKYKDMGVVPVGRLDKDTEGVLLFSNDGELIHRLISPKNNFEKTYYAVFEGTCPEDAKQLCKNGVRLKDGTICRPSVFEKVSENEFKLTITEGMYHQIKRMAAAMGMHVIKLVRRSFAGITCENHELGSFFETDFQL